MSWFVVFSAGQTTENTRRVVSCALCANYTHSLKDTKNTKYINGLYLICRPTNPSEK